MAATDKNMTFDVNLLPATTGDHNLGSSSLKWKINGVSDPKLTDNNTTYIFANGTNGFTVTPSGGTAQTVTVTPNITNNITGSGISGYLVKFNGTNTITSGPQLGNNTTTYLRNDGTWVSVLPTAGGTMTGDINMGTSTADAVSNRILWRTVDGTRFSIHTYNNLLQIYMIPEGGSATNVLGLYSDGTIGLSAIAWRTALGLGSTSGALPVANGGTGLSSSPSMLVNLASTTAANVMQASPRPGVTGALTVTNGGTGATTPADARSNLGITPANIGALPISGGTMTGNINMGQASATGYARRLTWQTVDGTTFQLSTINNALQIARQSSGSSTGSSVLTLYSDGSVSVPAAAWRNALGLGSTSGALPVANGGTGSTTPAGARSALEITPANINAFGLAQIVTPSDLNNTDLIGRTFINRLTCSNCPSTSYQYYYVLCFGAVQVAFAHASTGIPMMYVRHYTNSQWYPWRSTTMGAVS